MRDRLLRNNLGRGMTGMSGVVAGGPTPPPILSNWIVFYEAEKNVTLSGSPAANYGKNDTWAPVYGSGNQVQATDSNRMRWRTSYPVVYQWQAEGSRTMANTTAVIDKRNASIFCLIELGQLIVNGIAENQTLVSLPGAVGELYLNKAASSRFKVSWKDGTGTYVSSLIPASSLNLIGVTLSAGAVVVHCNGQSETLAAAALAAGTVTGFSINFGTLSYGDAWGYNFVGITNNALDAGELTAVETWGISRGAVYPALTTDLRYLASIGASRSVGYFAEGNMDYMWQLSKEYPSVPMYKNGFGGINTTNLLTRERTELALQNEGGGSAAGTSPNSLTKKQMIVMEIPTADITSGTAEATIISNLTTLREEIRASGYELILHCCAPVATWDPGQETKRVNVNNAMLALDARRYGDCIAVITELTNASNPVYYYDDTHWTKAGYDPLKVAVKPYVETCFARTITTLKARWQFNGNLQDDSGYRRDMIQFGTPTYTTGLNGKQCLVTSPTNNFVRHASCFRNYDFLPLTFVCWFQGKAAADDYIAYKLSFAGGSKSWGIQRHQSTSQIRFSMTDLVGECRAVDKSYVVDTWYCIAFILDAANGGRLYTSDAGGDASTLALRDTDAWVGAPVVPYADSGVGQLRIGCYGSDTGATSTWIQSPQIYYEALSLSQLQALTP